MKNLSNAKALSNFCIPSHIDAVSYLPPAHSPLVLVNRTTSSKHPGQPTTDHIQSGCPSP